MQPAVVVRLSSVPGVQDVDRNFQM